MIRGSPERTRLGPPGVDVKRFAPRPPAAAAAGLRALAAGLAPRRPPAPPAQQPASAFARDTAGRCPGARASRPRARPAGRVRRQADPQQGRRPAARRLAARARARAGRSPGRRRLRRLPGRPRAVSAAPSRTASSRRQGRLPWRVGRLRRESAEARPLRHLLAFLDSLHGAELERYMSAARNLEERVVLTGRLEHEELAELLPACEALVVPSTFPEAFGMVAVEAAACGALPVSAAHSGLAEVSDALARSRPTAGGAMAVLHRGRRRRTRAGRPAARLAAGRSGAALEHPRGARSPRCANAGRGTASRRA